MLICGLCCDFRIIARRLLRLKPRNDGGGVLFGLKFFPDESAAAPDILWISAVCIGQAKSRG
jgi:hypothetical protein